MGIRLTLQQADRRERRGMMAALDSSHCLLWFDPEGYVIDANPNAQSLLNCNHKRLTNWSYRELTGRGSEPDAFYRDHWQRIVTGRLRAEERDLKTGTGQKLWCALTHAPLLTGDQRVKLVFTLLVDLTPWSHNPREGLRQVY